MRLAVAILLLGLLSASGPTRAAAQTDIRVTVEGVRNDIGLMRIGLYDDPAVFPDEQQYIQRVFFEAEEGTVVGMFEDVEPGTYAIAVYHDENESDSLQRNLVGKPTEGYGFSNGAKARLRDPPFEKAAFVVSEGAGGVLELTIKLKY